jgi:hypothetical protein
MDRPPEPLGQARTEVPGVQIGRNPRVVGGRRDPGHRRRHFPLRNSQTGVIGAPRSGENGFPAHAGVDPDGAVVGCVADGGVGANRATGALLAPWRVEREMSFTLVVIASVIKIANTAATRTATGRGEWK